MPTLYLVENAREGGRHVQRVVKALGRRDQMENSDLLDGLIASANRPLPPFHRVVAVLPGQAG